MRKDGTATMMPKEEADQFIASGELAASVIRAFEEAARVDREAIERTGRTR